MKKEWKGIVRHATKRNRLTSTVTTYIFMRMSKIKKMENNPRPALTNVDFCVVTHSKEETISLSNKLIFY